MKDILFGFDERVIYLTRRVSAPVARTALFVVYFWFGILKILHTSPANPLVQELMEATIPFLTFDTFIVLFSLYEILIGLVFLIPGLERFALALFIPHMVMTSLPLFVLPEVTWQGFLTPTLEGQYIIKNLVLLALAVGLVSRLTPWRGGQDESLPVS